MAPIYNFTLNTNFHLDHTLMKKNQKRFSMSYANNVCERSLFFALFLRFLVAALHRNDILGPAMFLKTGV